jgi:hypothetical protein
MANRIRYNHARHDTAMTSEIGRYKSNAAPADETRIRKGRFLNSQLCQVAIIDAYAKQPDSCRLLKLRVQAQYFKFQGRKLPEEFVTYLHHT